MPVDLYNSPLSAPCALVRMLAKHIGVELNVKDFNFAKKEHISPEYLKINPFHKVPTISDDGFLLYESTAVCLYLLNKYAPGSDLYPKDLQKRARVDQVLATVTSFVQPRNVEFFRNSIMIVKKPTAQQVQDLEELEDLEDLEDHKMLKTLKGLEHLVGDGQFAVGDALTLADLALVAHLSFTIVLPVFDREKFSKLVCYYERLSAKLPYFAETKTITDALTQKWSTLK